MYKQILPSDELVLESVESYLKKNGSMSMCSDKLVATQQTRDYLYSQIVVNVPRIAACIMDSQLLENDLRVQGLYSALSKHALDPAFIDVLMQYLATVHDQEQNAVTGALLVKILNKYIETKMAETKKKDEKPNLEEVAHLRRAVGTLLSDISSIVSVRCGNLTDLQAISIAACIAMNNSDTITEIIASDFAVTANLFDILKDPSAIITAALKLKKSDYTKTTANQKAFIDSLKRWVYDKLNVIPVTTCRQFLISVYGSPNPNVDEFLIQLKDCGTQYSNLLIVAKQMIN